MAVNVGGDNHGWPMLELVNRQATTDLYCPWPPTWSVFPRTLFQPPSPPPWFDVEAVADEVPKTGLRLGERR